MKYYKEEQYFENNKFIELVTLLLKELCETFISNFVLLSILYTSAIVTENLGYSCWLAVFTWIYFPLKHVWPFVIYDLFEGLYHDSLGKAIMACIKIFVGLSAIYIVSRLAMIYMLYTHSKEVQSLLEIIAELNYGLFYDPGMSPINQNSCMRFNPARDFIVTGLFKRYINLIWPFTI